jgi:hypothetical protein
MAKEHDKAKDRSWKQEDKDEEKEEKAEAKVEKKEHQNQEKPDTLVVNPVGAQEPYPTKGEEE